MTRFTLKQLKSLVADGRAICVNNATEKLEEWEQIGYASGMYGCNGKLFQGKSGQLYAVIGHVSAIYRF